MYKWIMFVIFAAASALGIYLMATQLPEKPVDEAASLPPGTVMVKIEANADFTFDQPEYKVKKGDKVILKLVNKSGIHGVAIPDLEVDLQGDKMEQEITVDQAGKFEMHCSIMCGTGHADMKSYLVVE